MTDQIIQNTMEALRKNELEVAQIHYSEHRRVQEHFHELRKPSFLLYFLLFILAICADLLGILFFFITFTGIGAVIASAISIFISIFFFLVGWWLGKKSKRINVSAEQISHAINIIEQRVQFFRNQTAQLIRFARSTQTGRKILRTQTGRKITGFAAKHFSTRSPVGRSALSAIAEIIPFLQLLPWYTINMYFTHRDHRRAYENAASLPSDYSEKAAEEQETITEYQVAQQEEAMAASEEEYQSPISAAA